MLFLLLFAFAMVIGLFIAPLVYFAMKLSNRGPLAGLLVVGLLLLISTIWFTGNAFDRHRRMRESSDVERPNTRFN